MMETLLEVGWGIVGWSLLLAFVWSWASKGNWKRR